MNLQDFRSVGMSLLVAVGSVSLGLSAAEPIAAQGAGSAELKTADAVIQRFVEAIGGETVVRKLTQRTTKGSLELQQQGVSVELKVESKAPNKRLTTIILPGGAGELATGFDGTAAWRSIPVQGVVDLTGEEARSTKEESNFWESVDFKSAYSKLELKGSAKVAGADCYVIEATPSGGKTQKIYFSKQSGLIVRRDSEAPTPTGSMAPTETYFEDYRTVDGMKMAFKMRRTLPEDFAFTFVTSEVNHTTPIPDSRFKKPETK